MLFWRGFWSNIWKNLRTQRRYSSKKLLKINLEKCQKIKQKFLKESPKTFMMKFLKVHRNNFWKKNFGICEANLRKLLRESLEKFLDEFLEKRQGIIPGRMPWRYIIRFPVGTYGGFPTTIYGRVFKKTSDFLKKMLILFSDYLELTYRIWFMHDSLKESPMELLQKYVGPSC